MKTMNNAHPTISIIIPVYQTERYLSACIDSVTSQTFSDFELLLIDDGSRDKSGVICDRYAEEDSRIRVFHQKNQGQSVAQNLGLKHMRGEYVTIVDSDDVLLSKDYLGILLDAITNNKSQISVCKTVRFSEDDEPPYSEQIDPDVRIISGEKFCYMQRSSEGYAFNSSCAKLYRRSLFNNISYPSGRLSQDVAVAHKLAYPCKKIALVSAPFYGYRQWKGSTSISSPSEKIFGDIIFAFQERIRYFKERGKEDLSAETEQLMLHVLAYKKMQLRNGGI